MIWDISIKNTWQFFVRIMSSIFILHVRLETKNTFIIKLFYNQTIWYLKISTKVVCYPKNNPILATKVGIRPKIIPEKHTKSGECILNIEYNLIIIFSEIHTIYAQLHKFYTNYNYCIHNISITHYNMPYDISCYHNISYITYNNTNCIYN